MSIPLIVSIIVAVASAIVGIAGGCTGSEGMVSLGSAFFILALFLGFGLICGLTPSKIKKTEIKNYEIIKTDNSVIVDSRFGTRTFKAIKYLDLTKNDIKVLHVKKYNSYGAELKNYMKIKEIKEESNE